MEKKQLIHFGEVVAGTETCATEQDGSVRIGVSSPANAGLEPSAAQPMAPSWHTLERLLSERRLEEPC